MVRLHVLALILGACGSTSDTAATTPADAVEVGDSAPRCTAATPNVGCCFACSHVYDACGLVLHDPSGAALDFDACLAECTTPGAWPDNATLCVNKAKCTESDVRACTGNP